LFHFTRRADSARLGRSTFEDTDDRPKRRTFFDSSKRSYTYPTGQTESLTKNGEEYQSMINNHHHPRTNSTNLSRATQEQQPLTVVMTKNNDDGHVSLPRKPDLLREYSKERKRILMA